MQTVPAPDINVKINRSVLKCVVWDLDNTLWSGVFTEVPEVILRDRVTALIRWLDERGVLNSIASKNDPGDALAILERHGLREYFVSLQIGWGLKSDAIRRISEDLNLPPDSMAFVDDQAFERDEVRSQWPQVKCFDVSELDQIRAAVTEAGLTVTEESRTRRSMYMAESTRKQAESEFVGSNEAFLASLRLQLTFKAAEHADLERAHELTIRTHQLNSTGRTFSFEQLVGFIQSPTHDLVIAGLADRYGKYGTIGLALIERSACLWTVKLLIMSCRVLSRGIGSLFISFIMLRARDNGVRLRAEFVKTEKNRIMYVTYRFMDFREVATIDDVLVLETGFDNLQSIPDYIRVDSTW